MLGVEVKYSILFIKTLYLLLEKKYKKLTKSTLLKSEEM